MTPTDIWNHDAINARTDAAIAAEPTDLPMVGTMVMAYGDRPAIVLQTCSEHDDFQTSVFHLSGFSEWLAWRDWTYATPDQRQKAWEGE